MNKFVVETKKTVHSLITLNGGQFDVVDCKERS